MGPVSHNFDNRKAPSYNAPVSALYARLPLPSPALCTTFARLLYRISLDINRIVYPGLGSAIVVAIF